MTEIPAEYANHGTPTVVIRILDGGGLDIVFKSEGCILLVEDYDNSSEELQAARELCLTKIDADEVEYESLRWTVDETIAYNPEPEYSRLLAAHQYDNPLTS